jgi:formamidopyrimidine-DNA glycosylase
MDQSLFAGVGNYIRAEALYLSRISPWRLGSSLSKEELSQLCQDIIKVMKDSYQHQGATIRTYEDAFGAEGKHANFFKVYGKSHDEMGNLVISELTPEGRTIHWCPAVQF